MDRAAAVVERFLDRMAAHDWDAVAACLAVGVVRVGPYRDVCRGRDDYVAFLARTLPALPGYALRVDEVWAGSAERVVVRLSETVSDPGGAPLETPEALLFELDGDGRIARVEVFLQRSFRP